MNETTEQVLPEPQVTRETFFSLQVCVPESFTDEQVEEHVNGVHPSGTIRGWRIRKEGEESLKGDPERNPCVERQGCVHIVLDC